MKSILVVSFSPIARDPRVRRQIDELAKTHRVTVAGYGPFADARVTYVRLTSPAEHLWRSRVQKVLLLAGLFRVYYWRAQVEIAELRNGLAAADFDVVLVNDIDPLPYALETFGRHRTVLDAHEYAPQQGASSLRWRLVHGRFRRWVCRRYIPEVARMSTVSPGLAREYEREFALRWPVLVIPNTPHFEDLTPSSVDGSRIELVHHGLAGPDRGLEILIEAVEMLKGRFHLTLFLVESGGADYLNTLRRRIATAKYVDLEEPLEPTRIVEGLNRFDMGVFIFPSVTPQHEFVLPNKFFEFIQARLGVVVGPSPDMAKYVEEFGLGLVTKGFEVDDLHGSLRGLTEEEVVAFKGASARAAQALSWESFAAVLVELIDSVE